MNSAEIAIREEYDLQSTTEIIATHPKRHTDRGKQMQQRIDALWQLLHAYRDGLIKETA